MKVCPKCKLNYDDEYRFCKKCGNELSVVSLKKQGNVKICPKCKLEFKGNFKFCKKCGSILKAKIDTHKDLPKDGLLVPSEKTQLVIRNSFYLLFSIVFAGIVVYFYTSTFKYKLYDMGFNTLSDSEEFLEMGYAYSNKGLFILKDYDKAFKAYQISADMGNRFAKYQIAKSYFWGRGVNQDKQEARKWLELYFKKDKYEWYEHPLTQPEIDKKIEEEFFRWQEYHKKGWD